MSKADIDAIDDMEAIGGTVREAGYSLLELLIVIVAGSTLLAAAAVNIIPIAVSINIENAAIETAASIGSAREAALAGKADARFREFKLNAALQGKNQGIVLSEKASLSSTSGECGSCAAGEQKICISGIAFCYRDGANFVFEKSSGRLDAGRAVFASSKTRKFAVLVSRNGKADLAELVNGEWKSRTELLYSNGDK